MEVTDKKKLSEHEQCRERRKVCVDVARMEAIDIDDRPLKAFHVRITILVSSVTEKYRILQERYRDGTRNGYSL